MLVWVTSLKFNLVNSKEHSHRSVQVWASMRVMCGGGARTNHRIARHTKTYLTYSTLTTSLFHPSTLHLTHSPSSKPESRHQFPLTPVNPPFKCTSTHSQNFTKTPLPGIQRNGSRRSRRRQSQSGELAARTAGVAESQLVAETWGCSGGAEVGEGRVCWCGGCGEFFLLVL